MQEQEVTLQDLYRTLRQKIHESGLLGEALFQPPPKLVKGGGSARGTVKCPPGQGKFGGVCKPMTPSRTQAPAK